LDNNKSRTAKSTHFVKKLFKCLAKILQQEEINLGAGRAKGRNCNWRNVASLKAAGNSSLWEELREEIFAYN